MQSPDTTQIVAAYEDAGMPIEQIAECFAEGNVLNVKMVLQQFSSKYRDHIAGEGKGSTDDFTAEQQKAAMGVIYNVMTQTEDDYLRLRSAMYIRNDVKGRLDKVDEKRLQINIGQLNAVFSNANSKLKSILSSAKVIDIPTKEREMLEAASV